MKKVILYYGLLSKRFFKKASFVILLLSIPLLTAGLRIVSHQDSGMLKIILCAEDGDALTKDVMGTLMKEKTVLQFTVMDNAEEAREAVRNNQADAAWIFAEEFQEKLDFYSMYGYSENVPVLVVEREDTIPLQLSKIKLFGVLYPHVAYSAYQHFAKEELLPQEDISDEALLKAYEISSQEGSLFNLAYMDFTEGADSQNYITAPLRGLLSLMILLCGFAAAMFFYQDEEQGMFDGISLHKRHTRLYFYELAAMAPAAFVSLAALFITGNTEQTGWECLIMAVFLLDCTLFCSLLKRILHSSKIMGAVIPLLLLGMLVLCPIFFSYRGLRMIQILLPPYYYLNAVHNTGYLAGMLLHAAVIGTGFCISYFKPGRGLYP